MKLIEIINLSQNLKTFIDKGIVLPYPVARALSKNYTLFSDEIKIFEEERKKIVGDKNIESLTDNEKNEINIKFEELLNADIDIDFNRYDENLLDGCSAEISVKDMILLEYFMTTKDN